MKLNFKKINLMRHGHLFGNSTGPDADWKIIFSFLASGTVVVLLVGLYVFVQVNRGKLFVVARDTTTEEPRLNAALLSKTIKYYQTKASNLNQIIISKETIKDPSL
ncbi:hypothetical protein KW785_03370 [Candidatus Parcubacteria bacterium]|nr:hypothetical protein [Candidatus Parcubacteria bacterium]